MADGSNGRTELDKVASEACTRSGTFALLISVVLVVLCGSWQQRKADQALGVYFTARLNLAMFFDQLQNDEIWKKYVLANADAEQKTLAQLIQSTVDVGQTAHKTEPHKADEGSLGLAVPQATNLSSLRVNPPTLTASAPTGLSASAAVTPFEISSIVESWKKLNDSEILTRSRETSNYFSFSIARWVNRRTAIMNANSITGVCTAVELAIPRKLFKPEQYVARMNDEALLNCVTLRDLRELAQFELPQMSAPPQLGTKIGRDVDLSPGSLPKDPYAASLVAEALLFFTLIYFSAFTREAVSTELFPARGTLFGAFSRTRWILLVFYLALWTPFLACCAVGFSSGKVLLGLAAVPVFLATWSAHRTLAEKSFFESIRMPAHDMLERLRRKPA